MIDLNEIERVLNDETGRWHVSPDAISKLVAEVRSLRAEVELLTATQAACDGGSCEHDGCQRQDLTGYRETAARWVTEYLASKKDAERWRALLRWTTTNDGPSGDQFEYSYQPSGYNGGKWCWIEIGWPQPQWQAPTVEEMNAAIDAARGAK